MAKRGSEVLPVDRGWAWVVVISAGSLFGMQAAEFKVQGALLVELTERFEGVYPTSTLIQVFTIKYVLAGLLGPLVGILIVKLTHRVVAIIGMLLAASSFIGLAYASSPVMIFFLHCIPSGTAQCCVILSALLVTGQYFNKRKALALGLTAAGSGIGQITLPYIYRFVFDNYDFSGACILLAGFSLQFVVPACLYRPMSYYEKRLAHRNTAMAKKRVFGEMEAGETEVGEMEVGETEMGEMEMGEMSPEETHTESVELRERSVSFSHQNRLQPPALCKALSSNQVAEDRLGSQLHMVSIGNISGAIEFIDAELTSITPENNNNKPMKATKDKFMWKVIVLPKFVLLSLAVFVYAFGMCGVFQGIPALAKESGVSKHTVALAITIAGCLEIPCRIANGLLADKRIVTNTMQFTISLMIPGVMCLLCAIISGLPGIALVLIGMATVGTSVFSIAPVVIAELVGVEYVTSGMSVHAVYQSIAFLSSTFVIGAIYDFTSSWIIVYYYVAAAMLTASAIMWSYVLLTWCKGIALRRKA